MPMIRLLNFIRSPAMALESFYSDLFGKATVSDGGDFGSLWKTVRYGGGITWRLAIIILGWTLAITSIIGIVVFFGATKGNSRDEAKERLKRILIIAFFAGGLLGIVGVITSFI